MRTFINGNGDDVTTATVAFLKANNQFRFANLVQIGPLEDPASDFITDYDGGGLVWSPIGTFLKSTFTRGKIESKVGLEVMSMDFEWSPIVQPLGITIDTANFYQKAQSGFYDNRLFKMWRSVVAPGGDANTYGACELFGGRIGKSTVERGKITFNVASFLDVINQKWPLNVIESQNTLANYSGAVPVISDGETQVPVFSVVAPSSQNNINAQCLSPTLNKIYGTNKFQFGYIQFVTGALRGYYSQIAASGKLKISGTNYNNFFLYEEFPWSPQIGDHFIASIKPPTEKSGTTTLFPFRGFIYVPQPESAA